VGDGPGKKRPDDRWRIRRGHDLDLTAIDPASTSGAPGGKATTVAASQVLATQLADLQARLWAEAERSVLVVLQAMDAGGKDGTVKHVFSGLNPMAIHAVAFKAPSPEELDHDYLWRVHRRTPARGHIGIFNRSHYEDVLVARVEGLVPKSRWRRRYGQIEAFEAMLHDEGTTVLKVFLHISPEEQAARFQARLKDRVRNFKFRLEDLEVRKQWHAYREAYTDAIAKTTTDDCPWYVVPADHKWYRNWAVSTILVSTLERLDPQWPKPAEDLQGVEIPDVS
jgi:PPK2 family polyphosphate:nucleotide phosphotransferase